ncbi:MAG: GNAT family N-acetyltransferase [Proteobacteria bacterium]|nr:GNAT family N-acetyltransferase [Pseudomonadota bacterium]MCH9757696.1 GNAT family N-acetyltransferase [Pseudomonadota bacterium]
MTLATLTIKTATRAEVDIAIDWAAKEGWNPGQCDADNYFCADPTGFLIGYLEQEPVATISAVKYGANFGFIGFYIVRKEQRNRGLGMQIWNAAMASLQGRCVGLDGVIEQQDNYKKSGFAFAYSNIRFEGITQAAATNAQIVPLAQIPLEQFEHYDRPFFAESRTAFMQQWIQQPQSVALGYVADGQLKGYAVIRPCASGYKIAPLFADSASIAAQLFAAVQAAVPPNQPLYLDVPEVNTCAVKLATDNNMSKSFESARMYKGEAPKLPLNSIYGVTSFEVG